MSTKKRGGGKLARSETVTVRFDPKLRYMAELAARKHRRTLSSFIEWAVEKALNSVIVNDVHNIALGEQVENLWDIDEPDRVVKLGINYPDLLTHDEQIIWKLVKENSYFWRKDLKGNYYIQDSYLNYENLREQWDSLKKFAEGKINKADLPIWQDDDLPF